MMQHELEELDHILTLESYQQWLEDNKEIALVDGNLVHAYLRAHGLPITETIKGLT